MSSAKEAATAAVELAKEKADAISKKKDDVESYIMHKLRAPKCVDDFLLVKQNVGEILTSIKDAADRQKVIKSKKRKIIDARVPPNGPLLRRGPLEGPAA